MTPRTRFAHVLLAFPLAVGGIALTAGPAAAAPTVTSPASQSVVTPDAIIDITGAGCPGSAPVSIEIKSTGRDIGQVLNSDVLPDAGPDGTFSFPYDLDNRWIPGEHVRLAFSCTATFDHDAGESLFSGYRYFWIQPDETELTIGPITGGAFGLPRQIVAISNPGIDGIATLAIDAAAPVLYSPGSTRGRWIFEVPTDLAVGTHQLTVKFDPFGPGLPAEETATLTVTKASPTVVLTTRKKVQLGKKVRVRVAIGLDGIASRAGKVVIKDGKRKVGKVQTDASGLATKKIKLTDVGRHRLRVVFKGNAQTARATSPVVKVRVRR